MLKEPINLMRKDECWIDVHHGTENVVIIDMDGSLINIFKHDAIAAARAILKHFQVGVE